MNSRTPSAPPLRRRAALGVVGTAVLALGALAPTAALAQETDEDLNVWVSPESLPQWDLSRGGVEITAVGLEPDAPVTVSGVGEERSEFVADEYGDLYVTYQGEHEPGEYEFVVETDGSEGSAAFTVVADDEWFADQAVTPQLTVGANVITESELAEAPVRARATGFYEGDYVDFLLDGERVETKVAGIAIGDVEHWFEAPLPLGEHTVSVVHPTGEASETFHVIPDEDGDAPYAGEYAGTSVQTHSGAVELDDPTERAISFRVDEDGAITDLAGGFSWVCLGSSGVTGSGTEDFADAPMPATRITVDRPFEFGWYNDATTASYVIDGTVRSDGTASGTITFGLGICGYSLLTWTTELDGATPEPVPEPTPVPTPEPEPTPEPTPDPTPTPSPIPDPTPSPEPSPDPSPVPDPTPEPTPGPSPSPDPAPEPSPDPEPTPAPSPSPDPGPAPGEDPAPDPEPSPDPAPEPPPAPDKEPVPDEQPAPDEDSQPAPGGESPADPAPGEPDEDGSPLLPTGGTVVLPAVAATLMLAAGGITLAVMAARRRTS